MSRTLPPQPNLDHLRREAKAILKRHRGGSAQDCATLRHLRSCAGRTDREILLLELTLAEVQYALAKEYGLESWSALKRHAADTKSSPAPGKAGAAAARARVRTMHLVQRDRTGALVDERWVEIGPDGLQAKYRQDTSSRGYIVVDDGQIVMRHYPAKNTAVLYESGTGAGATWHYAPGRLLDELAALGPDYSMVRENVQYKGKAAHHLRWAIGNLDVYIDPVTKLPLAHGPYDISYEQPPGSTFAAVAPEGATVVDRRPGATPCVEPEWMLEERQQEALHDAADRWFQEGRRALAAGDNKEAVALLGKTVEIWPGRNWAWLWLARALHNCGDYDAAVCRLTTIIDTMLAEHGTTIQAYYWVRALAYKAKGMHGMADLDLQKALPSMVQGLRSAQAAGLFDLVDDPLIRADGMREGCHEPPTRAESLTNMINRLRAATEQSFGYDPAANPPESEAAIAAWEAWLASSD